MTKFELDACVVSIRHQADKQQIVGTGFVVTSRHVLTCAHVVQKAGAAPEEIVKLKFHKHDTLYSATVVPDFYRDEQQEDFAVLRLAAALPPGVQTAFLAFHQNPESHPAFRTFGFRDLSPNLGPSTAYGHIVGMIESRDGFSVLQMSSNQEMTGMSGGPVLETEANRIVGMILSQSTQDDTKIALPVAEMKRIWPDLPLRPPEKKPMSSRIIPEMPKMQLVPASSFLMGSTKGSLHAKNNETLQHSRDVPAFYLARYPVTNAEYAIFVQSSSHSAPEHWQGDLPPADKLDHPVVGVDYFDTQAYCRWLSKALNHSFRLPREEEWEKAARGTADTRIYTWGDEWDVYRCNSEEDGLQKTTPVHRYEAVQENPYNIADMLGNVWEWVDEWYGPYDGGWHQSVHYGRKYRVLRGGSFMQDRTQCRVSQRGRYLPDTKRPYLGFRLATDRLPATQIYAQADAVAVNSGTGPTLVKDSLQKNNRRQRETLKKHFSVSELQTLALDLGLEPEDLPEVLTDLAQELLRACRRRGKVEALFDLVRRERPGVNWDFGETE